MTCDSIDTFRDFMYDDKIVRQIIKCIIVESKDKIKVIFIGGMEVEQELN